MEERTDALAAAVAKTTETATQAADVSWQLYTEKKHEQASKRAAHTRRLYRIMVR